MNGLSTNKISSNQNYLSNLTETENPLSPSSQSSVDKVPGGSSEKKAIYIKKKNPYIPHHQAVSAPVHPYAAELDDVRALTLEFKSERTELSSSTSSASTAENKASPLISKKDLELLRLEDKRLTTQCEKQRGLIKQAFDEQNAFRPKIELIENEINRLEKLLEPSWQTPQETVVSTSIAAAPSESASAQDDLQTDKIETPEIAKLDQQIANVQGKLDEQKTTLEKLDKEVDSLMPVALQYNKMREQTIKEKMEKSAAENRAFLANPLGKVREWGRKLELPVLAKNPNESNAGKIFDDCIEHLTREVPVTEILMAGVGERQMKDEALAKIDYGASRVFFMLLATANAEKYAKKFMQEILGLKEYAKKQINQKKDPLTIWDATKERFQLALDKVITQLRKDVAPLEEAVKYGRKNCRLPGGEMLKKQEIQQRLEQARAILSVIQGEDGVLFRAFKHEIIGFAVDTLSARDKLATEEVIDVAKRLKELVKSLDQRKELQDLFSKKLENLQKEKTKLIAEERKKLLPAKSAKKATNIVPLYQITSSLEGTSAKAGEHTKQIRTEKKIAELQNKNAVAVNEYARASKKHTDAVRSLVKLEANLDVVKNKLGRAQNPKLSKIGTEKTKVQETSSPDIKESEKSPAERIRSHSAMQNLLTENALNLVMERHVELKGEDVQNRVRGGVLKAAKYDTPEMMLTALVSTYEWIHEHYPELLAAGSEKELNERMRKAFPDRAAIAIHQGIIVGKGFHASDPDMEIASNASGYNLIWNKEEQRVQLSHLYPHIPNPSNEEVQS